MNLLLEQYYWFDSEREIICDACKIFFGGYVERKFDFNDACTIFKSRFGKVDKGEQAIYLSVVNTDTAELSEMNCRKDMHELLLKHKLYPLVILNILRN